MASANGWSLSARQGFVVCGLFTAGLFVLCCGTGMNNVPVAALGVAVGLLGPTVIALSSIRANRPDLFGTAHVSQSSPPPPTGVTGRADLHLVVNAQGVHNAVVRVRDASVPVSKWPDVGATLPVLIPNGNPRRLQVLWDHVRRHHDVAMDDMSYSPYLEEDYLDEGVDYRGSPIDEPVDEPFDEPVVEPFDEPVVEQTSVTEPVVVDESPQRQAERTPSADAPSADAPVPTAVVSAAHLPGAFTAAPVSEAVAAPAETVAAPVSEAVAAPVSEAAATAAPARRRPSPRPRRRAAPADPVEEFVPLATAASQVVPPVDEPLQTRPGVMEAKPAGPDPYVASYLADEYLTDDPEHAQQGLSGVHNVSVTVIVSDLRRSLTFYRDLLGLTEIDGGTGSAILASGNARIMLREVSDTRPVDRRVVHLNLEVDDVHEAYERLRREGVEFMHPPRVVNQGEQLEQWAATLRDPDGHAIALTHWEVRP